MIILTGGYLWFGDDMPPRKLAGVLVAFAGIVYYTQACGAAALCTSCVMRLA